MNIGVISVRYARALLKSALDKKVEDKVYQDMVTLADSYLNIPQLKTTVSNPMLSKDTKKNLLLTASGTAPEELTGQFIDLVLKQRRDTMLQFMAAAFITLYREHKKLISGKLVTATEVSAETEQRMKQLVQERTQGTVSFQSEVNPDIIGGFILEYDSYRMDASVKTRLKEILKKLKK